MQDIRGTCFNAVKSATRNGVTIDTGSLYLLYKPVYVYPVQAALFTRRVILVDH